MTTSSNETPGLKPAKKPLTPRKRPSRFTTQHEDDDWLPRAAVRLPTRTGSEFFENDYDLM